MSKLSWMKSIAITSAIVGVCAVGHAKDRSKSTVTDAEQTIETFKKTDPGLSKFFDESVGYVVFPSINKGAFGIGGAGGKGVLFERGDAVGKATLTQVTVGAQMGGQNYAEIVFFETPEALNAFKRGESTFAAQVSAVAAASGASRNAKYNQGVAVFTATNTGLMYEASIGGQKFKYTPFKNKE